MENFSNIEFYDFSIKINKSLDPDALAIPGIFAIYCTITKRAFFGGDSYNILYGIERFFDDLLSGNIKNDQLLADFKLHGKEAFVFYVFDADLEFENDIKRNIVLSRYQNIYSNILY